MEIKSRRFIIAILVGMLVGLAITIYLQPACVGAVISVIVSAYLAKAASPKDGAIVGAITLVPIGTYLGLWAILQVKSRPGHRPSRGDFQFPVDLDPGLRHRRAVRPGDRPVAAHRQTKAVDTLIPAFCPALFTLRPPRTGEKGGQWSGKRIYLSLLQYPPGSTDPDERRS